MESSLCIAVVTPPNLTEISDEHDQMHRKAFVKKSANMTRNHFVVLELAQYHSFISCAL